jgi:hypothetical protein
VVWKGGGEAKELAGYRVTFESEDRKTSGSGEIQPDATFKISTYGSDDGAVPGKHRVALTPAEFESDTIPPPVLVHQRYLTLDGSGLTVEIKPGPNPVVLEVERSRR